jgi:hypothetical protein
MANIRCPSCGSKGEVRGTEEFFEVRGRHPTSPWPVRKCIQCGAGFELMPRLLVLWPWPKARLIPPEFWREMEASWDDLWPPTTVAVPSHNSRREKKRSDASGNSAA